MARISKPQTSLSVDDLRHTEDHRLNNPLAAVASEGTTPLMATIEVDVSPRQTPTLRFGGELEMLLEKAARSGLSRQEGEKLAALVAVPEPQLSWAKKRQQL